VTPRDLFALAGAVPDGGLALAPAADGTTNALALASIDLFVPVYGPGSAARFAALGESRVIDSPNLIDDVDTIADLERLMARLGPHTRSVLTALREAAAA
jgi:2-phospho-L-lactate guanylyltransferase (CobY/MobA/RfbA family)